MIELSDVSARGLATPGEPVPVLRDLSAQFGPGTHAIVGGRADGVALLFSLVAGQRRPKRGTVTVSGANAAADASRRSVAYVPLVVDMPTMLTASEWLALAATSRGGPTERPDLRLQARGLARLAKTPVRALSRPERRAVALVEALTAPCVGTILLEEPALEIAGEIGATLAEDLAHFAERGVVVIGTTSLQDALRTCPSPLRLSLGVLGAPAANARFAEIVVETDDAARLGRELSNHAAAECVRWEKGRLTVAGTNYPALARAVRDAIVESYAVVNALYTLPAETPLAWPPPPPPAAHAAQPPEPTPR